MLRGPVVVAPARERHDVNGVIGARWDAEHDHVVPVHAGAAPGLVPLDGFEAGEPHYLAGHEGGAGRGGRAGRVGYGG